MFLATTTDQIKSNPMLSMQRNRFANLTRYAWSKSRVIEPFIRLLFSVRLRTKEPGQTKRSFTTDV